MAPADDIDPTLWDRLFAAPLDQFTAIRNELAADLKKQGKKDAAATLKAVPKPTMALWAVNTLARTEPFVVRKYLDTVDLLRKAQLGDLGAARDPGVLRDAIEAERTAQRNVAAAFPRALGAVGVDAKPGLVSGALEIVRAAARQEEARPRLREGRLVEAPAAATDPLAALLGGVAPTDEERAFLGRPRAPAPRPPPTPDDRTVLEAPDVARDAARRAAAARREEIARLRTAEAEAKRVSTEAERNLVKAREAVEALERKLRRAREEADAAEADADRARAAADEATARLRAAEAESAAASE